MNTQFIWWKLAYLRLIHSIVDWLVNDSMNYINRSHVAKWKFPLFNRYCQSNNICSDKKKAVFQVIATSGSANKEIICSNNGLNKNKTKHTKNATIASILMSFIQSVNHSVNQTIIFNAYNSRKAFPIESR